jgi:hypothetical protein
MKSKCRVIKFKSYNLKIAYYKCKIVCRPHGNHKANKTIMETQITKNKELKTITRQNRV